MKNRCFSKQNRLIQLQKIERTQSKHEHNTVRIGIGHWPNEHGNRVCGAVLVHNYYLFHRFFSTVKLFSNIHINTYYGEYLCK